MIEVELFGARLAPGGPTFAEVQRLCTRAAASAGIDDGHVAIEFVDAARIAELNAEYRGKPGPTDVLSFPIDGAEHAGAATERARTGHDGDARRHDGDAERYRAHDGDAEHHDGDAERYRAHDGVLCELGDVVISPEHTVDLREAIVHGVLHLVGMDHETDAGEMLALQAELLAAEQ